MGRKSADFAALQAAIRRIEQGADRFGKAVVTSGCEAFDQHLPGGGFARHACHEIGGVAATGFAAGLAGRALRPDRATQGNGYLIWCQSDASMRRCGTLYAPGLAGYGIAPERLLHVRAPDDAALLWAVEEVACAPAVACLIAETGPLDLLASRRLQLAAEEGGALVLLLRDGPRDMRPSAAATRLEVTPRLSGGQIVWRTELWRAKGAAPGFWDLCWRKDDRDALSLHSNGRFFAAADGSGESSARSGLAS